MQLEQRENGQRRTKEEALRVWLKEESRLLANGHRRVCGLGSPDLRLVPNAFEYLRILSNTSSKPLLKLPTPASCLQAEGFFAEKRPHSHSSRDSSEPQIVIHSQAGRARGRRPLIPVIEHKQRRPDQSNCGKSLALCAGISRDQSAAN